jgi:hypothetical protein
VLRKPSFLESIESAWRNCIRQTGSADLAFAKGGLVILKSKRKMEKKNVGRKEVQGESK